MMRSLLLAVVVKSQPLGEELGPIAVTSAGTYRGVDRETHRAFLGIRFGEAPTGERRWQPPVAAADADADGVVDATEYGANCLQPRNTWSTMRGPFDEDCLFLNVFSPKNASEPLPVSVFIHGGGFSYGGSHDTELDGEGLMNLYDRDARLKPTILVTLNYRLGVLGFLGSDAFRDAAGSTGNWGTLDQRLAMRWVQKHIAAFGGDARRVLLFGESAGAGAVSVHAVMPKSFGLFSAQLSVLALIFDSLRPIHFLTQDGHGERRLPEVGDEECRERDVQLRVLRVPRRVLGRGRSRGATVPHAEGRQHAHLLLPRVLRLPLPASRLARLVRLGSCRGRRRTRGAARGARRETRSPTT